MNLKTFLETNNVSGFEIVPNVLILNVISNDAVYGLDVDTSNLVQTTLITVNEYSINNDILSVDNLTLDTNSTNLLGLETITD